MTQLTATLLLIHFLNTVILSLCSGTAFGGLPHTQILEAIMTLIEFVLLESAAGLSFGPSADEEWRDV